MGDSGIRKTRPGSKHEIVIIERVYKYTYQRSFKQNNDSQQAY